MAECGSCTAWVAGKDVTVGRCKAHPPEIIIGLNYGQPGSGVPEPQYLYPITNSADWCREHIPLSPPPAADTPGAKSHA